MKPEYRLNNMFLKYVICNLLEIRRFLHQGPVVRSLVSANRWLRGILKPVGFHGI